MAVIEFQEDGEGFAISNMAFQNILEFMIQKSTSPTLTEQLRIAHEVGYLTLDQLHQSDLRDFVDLWEKHLHILSTRPEVPSAYLERLEFSLETMK
ncbi:hypothetical protein [Deinococcus misasensis]|uniref:hypothetical protein n=1 Tax=Deinococcus misasensis TaxID=392413 RepID=UPI00054D2C12|nr:hypothetical protein [Deinococcus misasensis]